MKRGLHVIFVICLFLFALGSVSALTQLSSCSTLSTPGETYELTGDVTASGTTCFSVTADNVVLDCKGHTIDVAGNFYAVALNSRPFSMSNCVVVNSSVYAVSSPGSGSRFENLSFHNLTGRVVSSFSADNLFFYNVTAFANSPIDALAFGVGGNVTFDSVHVENFSNLISFDPSSASSAGRIANSVFKNFGAPYFFNTINVVGGFYLNISNSTFESDGWIGNLITSSGNFDVSDSVFTITLEETSSASSPVLLDGASSVKNSVFVLDGQTNKSLKVVSLPSSGGVVKNNSVTVNVSQPSSAFVASLDVVYSPGVLDASDNVFDVTCYGYFCDVVEATEISAVNRNTIAARFFNGSESSIRGIQIPGGFIINNSVSVNDSSYESVRVFGDGVSDTVVLQGNNLSSNSNFCFRVDNVAGGLIEGGSCTAKDGFGVVDGSTNVTILNLNVTSQSAFGAGQGIVYPVGIGDSANITVVNSSFSDVPYGIYVANSSNTVVRNSVFRNISVYAITNTLTLPTPLVDLSVENNSFSDILGAVLRVDNASSIVVKDNDFTQVGDRVSQSFVWSNSLLGVNGKNSSSSGEWESFASFSLFTGSSRRSSLADGVVNFDVVVVNTTDSAVMTLFTVDSLYDSLSGASAYWVNFGIDKVLAFVEDGFVAQGVSSDYDASNLINAFNSTFNVSSGVYPPSLKSVFTVVPLISNGGSTLTLVNNVVPLNVTLLSEFSTNISVEDRVPALGGLDGFNVSVNSSGFFVDSGSVRVEWLKDLSVSGVADVIKTSSGFVSVDSSSASSLNSSANVSFSGVDCGAFDLYYSPVFASSKSEVLSSGSVVATQANVGGDCVDSSVCQNVQCSGSTLTFEAQHFSGFATGGGGDSLTINDSVEGSVAVLNQPITFYAYYENSSGGLITAASCNVTLSGVGVSDQVMTEKSSFYEYVFSGYSSTGVKSWNVTCAKSGSDTLSASDTLQVVAAVPEWSDVVYVLLLGGLIGLFIIQKKKYG